VPVWPAWSGSYTSEAAITPTLQSGDPCGKDREMTTVRERERRRQQRHYARSTEARSLASGGARTKTALPTAASDRPDHPHRPPDPATHPDDLALGRRPRHCLHPYGQAPTTGHLTSRTIGIHPHRSGSRPLIRLGVLGRRTSASRLRRASAVRRLARRG
jgi:hypothetical protein